MIYSNFDIMSFINFQLRTMVELMRDQLQEVEAEEEASVVDSEVDFPVAAVASVVAEVILYTKRNNFKFLAYVMFWSTFYIQILMLIVILRWLLKRRWICSKRPWTWPWPWRSRKRPWS